MKRPFNVKSTEIERELQEFGPTCKQSRGGEALADRKDSQRWIHAEPEADLEEEYARQCEEIVESDDLLEDESGHTKSLDELFN